MDRFQVFQNGVKMVALYQATLEHMDTMKGTPLYRQNIKKMMRNLEREIERSIRGPLSALDGTDEDLMSTIQYKVEGNHRSIGEASQGDQQKPNDRTLRS